MTYQFNSLDIAIPASAFVDNVARIKIVLSASAGDERSLGSETFEFTIRRQVYDAADVLALYDDTSGAQYMQWGPYRTRLNTLFAPQLVALANQGINSVLSLATQHLPEPQPGQGGYVQLGIPAYQPAYHQERHFTLELQNTETYYPFYSGTLADLPHSLTLFIPVSKLSNGHYVDFPAADNTLGVCIRCGEEAPILSGNLSVNANSTLKSFTPVDGWEAAKHVSVTLLTSTISEPMDFSGANALYFWELFYYSPMLVAQRLLQEQDFAEATQWLKYVWSPSGYVVDGEPQDYYWNVRPLKEDISWNADPLDSADPDAVAQHDPMHYKLATFMRTLDLLIARGDHAYRQLERDTLNEAKMLYLQALNLLGEKPWLAAVADWPDPALASAADSTLQAHYQQTLSALRTGSVPTTGRSANSLVDLFYPQANEVLLNYWHTLEQRL